jgi:hypothetical protein
VAQAPTKLAVGQPLATTATFTLDPTANGVATGLGWSSFNGTITTKPSATQAGLKLKIAKTTLNTTPGGTTDSAAAGSTLTGTKVGTFTFKLGNLGLVHLNGFDATGKPAAVPSAEFPTPGSIGQCLNADPTGTTTLTAGGTAVTVTVVKDTTKTTAKVKYLAAKKTAVATAVVKSRFGVAPTGKVSFALKKAGKTIRTLKGAVSKKGVAKVSFTKVKAKGKYTVVAKYLGSANLKRSTAKAVSFTVK